MPRGKKKKLAETGPIHEQHLQSGIEFLVKYSGSQLIEDIRRGQHFSAAVVSAAIQSLLDFNRKARQKSTPAVLTLSTEGIVLRDCCPQTAAAADTGSCSQQLVKASIDRIAYCTADKRNSRVFGFVARNRINETVELHVCKCANDKEAVQLAYSLNEAFKVAARNFAPADPSNSSTCGQAGTVLSIDEQPLVWSDSQAFSMHRFASATAANDSNAAAPAAAAASDCNGAAGHKAWVQFS